MALIKCRITQDYCYNDDYGNCHGCDIAKNNTTYLKPCPFCGSEAGLKEYNPYDGYQGNYSVWRIMCSKCKVLIQRGTKEEAIVAWNRRVGEE